VDALITIDISFEKKKREEFIFKNHFKVKYIDLQIFSKKKKYQYKGCMIWIEQVALVLF
jgi:hypothetical protein